MKYLLWLGILFIFPLLTWHKFTPQIENPEFPNEEVVSWEMSSISETSTYRKEIFKLVSAGRNLHEISNDEIPELQGLQRTLDSDPYRVSNIFVSPYRIGDYYLVLCGIGGGAHSPWGDECELADGAYSDTWEDWLPNPETDTWDNPLLVKKTTFNGVLIAKKGDKKWTVGPQIKWENDNAPKALIVRNGKLLLVTLNGDWAGSGEGRESIFTLNNKGKRNLTDCRFYLPDTVIDGERGMLHPKEIEKFEQYPLDHCNATWVVHVD